MNTSPLIPDVLAIEVERQLLFDLKVYGIEFFHPVFDWSEACIEGHATHVLGGSLNNFSNVGVKEKVGSTEVMGWVDFVHGGGRNPLFVFWDLLKFRGANGKVKVLKKEFGLPKHIWEKLPVKSKELCGVNDKYDANWCKDPLVIAWKRSGKKF